MATFPGAIPTYAGFTADHTLLQDNHASQHNSEQADIIALTTKVGTGASTPTSGLVLRSSSAGTSTWGQVVLTSDVTGVLPLQNGGTNATTAASARSSLDTYSTSEINTAISNAKSALFPVGCIYIETTGTNPGTLLGFGTWAAFGSGRTLIGNGTSDSTYTAGDTGGESTHVLTTAELASHTHSINSNFSFTQTDGASNFDPGAIRVGANANRYTAQIQNTPDTASAGSNTAHNNLPPYIVTYFWRRTA